MKIDKRILGVLFTLSLIGLFAEMTYGQAIVRVSDVKNSSMQQRHAVTGSLRAVKRGNVAALEAGQLIELRVNEGSPVKKGDLIAKIDSRRLEAQKGEIEADLAVLQADLKSREAELAQAKSEFERMQKLFERKVVTKQEVESLEATYSVSKAEIEAAKRRIQRSQQSLKLLQVRLDDTSIHAPYDATVINTHVEIGDWLQPGEEIVTLVSTGPIEAWLEVPERFVDSLNEFGEGVSVRTRATAKSSTVMSTRRVSDVDRRVRTIPFIVTLDNTRGLLTPGMSVDAWLPVSGNRKLDSVPKDAVIRSTSGPFVYQITTDKNDSKAVRVPVRILFETNDRVAIATNSLKPGDQVVVEGNERLMPGQTVTIIPEGKPSASTVAQR